MGEEQTVVVPKGTLRKKRWPKIVGIILLVLVVALASVVGYLYWFVTKSLPVIKGEITLPGLEYPVTVWRDQNGVPHIEARNEHDLYIAQGYVTAQDRLFQMDLSRRQASGRLSEVVGEVALDTDKFFRTFMLRRAAEASVSAYSEETLQILNWYAEGVNAFIRQAIESNTLPVEFTLLGYEPEEWTPIDSLAIGKFMAYDLGGQWEGQAFRYHMVNQLPEDLYQSILPSYPKDGATIIQAMKENPLDLSGLAKVAVLPDPYNGSNNWVISAEKSASGLPMLANDPHLGINLPSIWYEVHLKTNEIDASGVIFAGIPGIILGHNQYAAWGVTNLGPDVQDLYIERRNPENPYEFEYMGQWEKATVYTEEIKVKDADPVYHEVVVTRHGPIISDIAFDHSQDTALAMRWTALDPTTELEAVVRFIKSKNWDEFKEALEYFLVPAQNFVFASVDGTIAYRGNGLIPIRKNGDGTLPVPGWTDEYEWVGYIPWDELPQVVNPKEGYIATANNKVIGDHYPYHLTNSWAQPYRQARIQQVLESKEKLTVEDLKTLQTDYMNLHAEEFLPQLLSVVSQSNALRDIDRKAIDLLSNWNFVNDAELGAPLVYELWINYFDNVLFKPEISDDMMGLFYNKATAKDAILRRGLNGEAEPWIDRKGGMEKVAVDALQLAVDRAVELQGKNPNKWKWGKYHYLQFTHTLGSIKPLNLILNTKKAEIGGGRVTVGAMGWNINTGKVTHGAPWRTVIDMSDPLNAYSVVAPGQSGHFMSQWYKDQMDTWRKGEYHVTSIDPNVYQKDAYKLTLNPAP